MQQIQSTKPPTRARRMTLGAVTREPERVTRRFMVYGPPGVGKTTLAANAPAAIFLPIEDGLAELAVPRFPRPESLEDVLEAIETLEREEHGYRTLVLDSVSELEKLVHASMLAGKHRTIEEWGGGYNKWRQGAVDIVRPVLLALDRLRARRGMDVVLVAHAAVKAVKDPLSDGFDRYVPACEPLLGAYLVGWCDLVLFYQFEDLVTAQRRGTFTGRRLLRTEHAAGYEAKHRGGLPPVIEVPVEAPWSILARHLDASPEAELAAVLAELPTDLAARARAAAEQARGDRAQLVRITNHARALLAQAATTTQEDPS